MSWGFSNSDRLINILTGTAIVAASIISYQSGAIAKTSQEIYQIAETTTVQINNNLGTPGGTGVIIAKQGNTYTVLTANHVVSSTDVEYTIRTSKEKDYPVTNVQRLQTSDDAPDLAVLTFNTADNYSDAIAPLANSDTATKGAPIYVGGYPLPGRGDELNDSNQREFIFNDGIVSNRLKSRRQGYTLRHNVITRVGMSGGPVFDALGRVVGIHGQADISDSTAGDSGETLSVKTGMNSAIPINTFIAMTPQIGISVAVDNAPTGDNPTERLSNPKTARDYYARAIVLYDENKFQEAIENFNQALKLAPNYSDAYSRRGAAKIQAIGDSELELFVGKNTPALLEAVEDLNKALSFNPNDGFAYSYRGFARYFLQESQKAMEDANQALRIDPSDPEAYLLRGMLRSDYLKDNEGAIADYDRAISLKPTDFYAYGNRSLVRLEQKEYQKALEDINQAIQINPKHSNVYVIRSFVYIAQKNYQPALEDINKSLAINPNNYIAYVARGVLRYQQSDNEGAMADLNRAIAIYPESAEVYYLRGRLRYGLEDKQGALEDLSQALRINLDYTDAYEQRVVIRVEMEDYQGAMADANQLLRINPNHADAYVIRGGMRFKQGDKQGALADLQTALQLYRQQGNTESYQKVEEAIRNLQ